MANIARVTVTVPPFQGVWDIDVDQQFNSWELHEIKKTAGLEPIEVEEAMAKGDAALHVALAVIALRRAGRIRKEQAKYATDLLMEEPPPTIDEDEPAAAAEPDPTTPPPNGNDNATVASSGDASNASSASPADSPSVSGSPGSEPAAASE